MALPAFFTTPKGQIATSYDEFLRLTREEATQSQTQYQNTGNGGAGSGSSGSLASTVSDSGAMDLYDKMFDKSFNQTKELMGLTNDFREQEGATQRQMDDQAFKRLNAELETRKYMQDRGADLTNWQRNKDSERAIGAFKSFGQ
jgi:hypothetical protein